MLYTLRGGELQAPGPVLRVPRRGEAGTRRRFVAKDHALVFTSNGQVHHHWSPPDFRLRTTAQQAVRPDLRRRGDRRLPIELRTALFTPDRSQLLANEPALQLEDQVANFLDTWHKLARDQQRAHPRGDPRRQWGEVGYRRRAASIATALKVQGFNLAASAIHGRRAIGGGVGGVRRRKKVETYPDPTTLEGPDRLRSSRTGRVRYLEYMLNARDDFLESGRGALTLRRATTRHRSGRSTSPSGSSATDYVRVQLQRPRGRRPGRIHAHGLAQGLAPREGRHRRRSVLRTALQIVDELPPRRATGATGRQGRGRGGAGGRDLDQARRLRQRLEQRDARAPSTTSQPRLWPSGTSTRSSPGWASRGPDDRPQRAVRPVQGSRGAPATPTSRNSTLQGTLRRGDRSRSPAPARGAQAARGEVQPVDEQVELAAKQAVARSVLPMMPAFRLPRPRGRPRRLGARAPVEPGPPPPRGDRRHRAQSVLPPRSAAITRTIRCVAAAVGSCSQIRSTVQPPRFPEGRVLLGVAASVAVDLRRTRTRCYRWRPNPCSGHPCQKHPSRNTASSQPRKDDVRTHPAPVAQIQPHVLAKPQSCSRCSTKRRRTSGAGVRVPGSRASSPSRARSSAPSTLPRTTGHLRLPGPRLPGWCRIVRRRASARRRPSRSPSATFSPRPVREDRRHGVTDCFATTSSTGARAARSRPGTSCTAPPRAP